MPWWNPFRKTDQEITADIMKEARRISEKMNKFGRAYGRPGVGPTWGSLRDLDDDVKPTFADSGIELSYVVGKRSWKLGVDGATGEPRLMSAGTTIWTPGRTVVAVCALGCKEVPNIKCPDHNGCGFYAYKDTREARMTQSTAFGFRPVPGTWGEVILFGDVLEGTFGYRAQYAVPYRIDAGIARESGLTESRIREIARVYGMEVVNSWEASDNQ